MATTPDTAKAVVFGTVSAEDAAIFVEVQKLGLRPENIHEPHEYLFDPALLPDPAPQGSGDNTLRWFVLQKIRDMILKIKDDPRRWQYYDRMTPEICNAFFGRLGNDEKVIVMLNCVETWGKLGADASLRGLFADMTGIEIGAQPR